MEQTYIMIKPEGVKRGISGEIISRFERKGLKLVKIVSKVPTKEVLETHYAHLKDRPFFKGMVDALSSSMVICMIWEGDRAVEIGRRLIGETDPIKALPGTIRGDFGFSIDENVVHGSDSIENAKKEIELWF